MHTFKRFRRYIVFLFLIIPVILTLNACTGSANPSPVTKTGFAFDTVISITIYDAQKRDVLDECFALCEEYETLFSATRADSEIWKINHSGTTPVDVSFETASLIQSALFWCEQSNGILDLTMLPIAEEWHISEQMTRMSENSDYSYYIPDADTLGSLLGHVNYKNVVIWDERGNKVGYADALSDAIQYSVQLLDGDTAIDLGFIAKGYIADRLKETMLLNGIESGIIRLGGNILLIGEKPDGAPFQIGIQKPFGNAGEVISTVSKTDTSVVSSGCYERYFSVDDGTKNGRIYHHIFDTATGAPVQNDLLGVTIICDCATQGDALSTYCYILGLEKGLEKVRSLEGVEAVFVTQDYEVIDSSVK